MSIDHLSKSNDPVADYLIPDLWRERSKIQEEINRDTSEAKDELVKGKRLSIAYSRLFARFPMKL